MASWFTVAALTLVMLVASAASNTYSTISYEVGEDRNPTVAALFRGIITAEDADCAEYPMAVNDCGEMMNFKLTNEETDEITNRTASFGSRYSLDELNAGCHDYPVSMAITLLAIFAMLFPLL